MAKKRSSTSLIFVVAAAALLIVSFNGPFSTALKAAEEAGEEGGESPFFVKKGERNTTVSTEDGEVSTVRISDNDGWYHLEFITLEANALFLPVILQSEMVFYVHTGSGQINWTEEDETKQLELKKGDIYRLRPGTVLYIQSSTEMENQKLRIHAFFANAEDDLHEPAAGPYSSIRKLILGFDKAVLAAAFGVPLEAIEEMTGSADPGAIVPGLSKGKRSAEMQFQLIQGLLRFNSYTSLFNGQSNKKKTKVSNKKKTKVFNIFSNEPDFENCNGWSTIVSKNQLSALKGIDISVFMVNLTKGSMMGPHWNPRASEFGIGLHGQGMVTVVCPSNAKQTGCKNKRFYVEEGDVFAVPRFHPMTQVAFNNDSFVFMGFSTAAKNNRPQYLAGKASVLQTLDRDIVAISLNVTNTTVEKILSQQEEEIILDCTSCAEEEFKTMREDIKKEQEKEAKKKKEEEAKEEEEEKKREEEERKKQEEARKKEEEEKRKEEEEREKQEAKKKEEEEKEERKRQQEEEEEAEKREEQMRQEEEAAQEASRREEEARREKEEAKEKEEQQQQKEEEAARREEEAKREKEEAKKREEQKQHEEEASREAARREEEAKERKEQQQQEEEAAQEASRKEEEARREKEEAKKREEQQQQKEEEAAQEAARREEEAKRAKEEARKREEQQQQEEETAEEASRREEEARREKEEAKKKEEQQQRKEEEASQEAARSEEEAKWAKEEAKKREKKQREEEAAREAPRREEEAAEPQEEGSYEAGGTGWDWGEEEGKERHPGIEWGRRALKKTRGV